MKRLTKGTAVICTVLMLLSAIGCSYTVLGCTAYSCGSCMPEQVKQQVTDTIKEEISEAAPVIGKILATEQPTEAPKEEGVTAAANEAYQALDREMFIWFVTQDALTLHSYCKDASAFGIDAGSVPMTVGDLSESAFANRIAECNSWLRRLEKVDSAHLTGQNRLAYENAVRYFENEIAFDGLFYEYEPLDVHNGLHISLPLTLAFFRIKSEADVELYLKLLEDVPRCFDQVLAFEQERAARGSFMTETSLNMVLESIAGQTEGEHFLCECLTASLQEASWLSEEKKDAYCSQNDALVMGTFTDALKRLYDGLETLRPYCSQPAGARNRGESALAYYTAELRRESGTDMTPAQVRDFLDTASIDLYTAMMAANETATNRTTAFTRGSITEDERYLKTIITDIVPPMPDVSVAYKTVPEPLQSVCGDMLYLQPTVDGYGENILVVNPAFPSDMFALAREAYPGYLYQWTYQYALGTVPLFQMVTAPGGYTTGWALHSTLETARRADIFGASDSVVNVLLDQCLNAIILEASVMVHADGASVEEVRTFLQEWNYGDYAETVYQLVAENPFLYVTDVMGFCETFELVQDCREIADFADKEFYRTYLSWGPSSFELLREKMTEWTEQQIRP